jgi:hypothetical protein
VGDYAAAFRAIDELSKHFVINAPQMKAGALETAARAFSLRPSNEGLARACLATVTQALAGDDYATAERLIKLGEWAAQNTKNVALVTSVQARGRAVTAQQKEHEKIKPDLETLKSKPDDPDANARVGRSFCLFTGDWEKGLPLLAKGSDKKLQALAEKEMAVTNEPAAQAALGDGWYDLAEAEDGAPKTQL